MEKQSGGDIDYEKHTCYTTDIRKKGKNELKDKFHGITLTGLIMSR